MNVSKQESMNFVTSCHQVESTVIPVSIGKAWESIKDISHDKTFPSHIKSVKFTSGSAKEINSIFEITYADNSVWTFRLLEVSERKRKIAYELIGAEPAIDFSSMLTTISLHKVTEDDTTFLSWETDYSNDVNAHTVQDGKFKKLEYFKDLKKLFKQ